MVRAGLLALLFTAGGCAAGPAALTDLNGTSWRVVAVNSRAVPVNGDYSMRFDRGGVGSRFGCNSMGGQYRVTGDVLVVSNLASTLMGCPEPAGTIEREASLILTQPMRMSFTSNDRLGLSNGAGSITLDPAP